VSQAVEVIPPNWPLRTFAYRNPLIGFEHLPFDEAVSQAKQVLGGEGYLSTAEYRACYAEGRISEKELLSALRSREPELASQDSVRVGERSLHPEEILLVHFVYGIDPLDPKLLPWQLTEEDATHRIRPDVPQSIKDRLRSHAAGRDPEAVYIRSLWSGALKALDLSEDGSTGNHGHSPTTAKAGGSVHAEHGPTQQRIRTATEIIDDLTGSDLKREINEHMIKWCAACRSPTSNGKITCVGTSASCPAGPAIFAGERRTRIILNRAVTQSIRWNTCPCACFTRLSWPRKSVGAR